MILIKMKKEKQTFFNPKLRIDVSSINGKGMFATFDIKKDEVLVRWGGTFVNKRELTNFNKDKFLIFQVDKNCWIVEPKYFPEDDSYYMNHSCDPNSWMDDGITFVARKNIKKGKEITIDYAMFESESYTSRWKCQCKSKNCRRIITGKDYLMPELVIKYENHFSPVIMGKIK